MVSTHSSTCISRVRFYRPAEFWQIHTFLRTSNFSRLSASNVLLLIIIAGIGCAVVIFHSHKPTGSTNQPEAQANRKYKPTGSSNQPEVQTNRKYKPTGISCYSGRQERIRNIIIHKKRFENKVVHTQHRRRGFTDEHLTRFGKKKITSMTLMWLYPPKQKFFVFPQPHAVCS